MMKEALLKGRIHEIGEILDFGFQQKRKMAEGISNSLMEEIYTTAKRSGATGGKISGAGGGGFMIFYCPENTKYAVSEALQQFGGVCRNYQFVDHGVTSWSIYKNNYAKQDQADHQCICRSEEGDFEE